MKVGGGSGREEILPSRFAAINIENYSLGD
jgi:hypothetical protein